MQKVFIFNNTMIKKPNIKSNSSYLITHISKLAQGGFL